MTAFFRDRGGLLPGEDENAGLKLHGGAFAEAPPVIRQSLRNAGKSAGCKRAEKRQKSHKPDQRNITRSGRKTRRLRVGSWTAVFLSIANNHRAAVCEGYRTSRRKVRSVLRAISVKSNGVAFLHGG